MNDFNLNAKRQMFHFAKKNVQFLFKTFLLFNFIRFWGRFFLLKSCFQKEIKKTNCLKSKKHHENDHFEAFRENVNSNGYIKRAFKFVKWDRSYSLALICLKMKPKSPHNLRNRTACIQSRNSLTVFLFSYNHAACLQHA